MMQPCSYNYLLGLMEQSGHLVFFLWRTFVEFILQNSKNKKSYFIKIPWFYKIYQMFVNLFCVKFSQT